MSEPHDRDSLDPPPLNRLNLGYRNERKPELKLDTTPDALRSAEMVSPFAPAPQKSHSKFENQAESSKDTFSSSDKKGNGGSSSASSGSGHGICGNAPASQATPSGVVSPTTPSVMEGLAADMQARILALQQSRSGKSNLSRSSSVASATRPKFNGPTPPTTSPEERRRSIPLPAGGALALGRTPSLRSQQRASLSERRGMKLDLPAHSDNRPLDPPHRQAPSAPQARSTTRSKPKPFSDYNSYIDAETGSLSFAGKAVLHSKGIDFSSGTSFRISLDELEPIAELGSGNYGSVQKVLHVPTGVTMAMKEIRLELDEASFRQIIMELDVLHRCNMDNIVEFYGAFFMEGAVYICMEYMDGGSINKIYEGGIPEKFLKYITYQVVRGLRSLKEGYKIIHRDVKPTNMLCSTNGKVKLCDFGVSGNLVASIAKTNIGCQAYMAPERIRGSATNSTRSSKQPHYSSATYTSESDVWSLGLSIVEMSEGHYPYPPDSYSNIFSQLSAIVDGKPPALDPTKYSKKACDFVSRLVSKNPTSRPRYAEILRDPWLANEDWSEIEREMGYFVQDRLARGANEEVESALS